jgi:hypothetical protein
MASMTPEERSEFARAGGKASGKARAEKLSAAQRNEIARNAITARWSKAKGKP